ncbi:MAG: hypothetical protein M4579_003685 [Chaenotheca gracillima]|nr:MAG: hypothetical protein M4579_003685 [Chaenotheca gracillima]
MDHSTYNVIYVDRRALDNRVVGRRDSFPPAPQESTGPWSDETLRHHKEVHEDVAANVRSLLASFKEVYLCTSGSVCRSKVSNINENMGSEMTPTLVFIDVPPDDASAEVSFGQPPPTPTAKGSFHDSSEPGDESFYGLQLLQYIISEIQYQNFSKLIVPIAAISSSSRSKPSSVGLSPTDSARDNVTRMRQSMLLDTGQVMRLLDAGAADVLMSPFSQERVLSCAVHGYRARKEAARDQEAFLAIKRGRKRSWVGVDEEKPHAYLREAMVSGLMDGICNPHSQNFGESFKHTRIHVLQSRRDVVSRAIGSWSFSAHSFSDDELLHAALLMLQHALSMPELEEWRIPTESLTAFLIATRTAYNSFVPYHNFRHVVDVLQAVFFFLLQVGTLPPYPLASNPPPSKPASPMAALLRPFDALTLLISAIGHDVGHPGVNNAFLVTLNAPLAQLYNDQSVLESFHCAAFSQILRRYWPASFRATAMRKLLISLILATDMGLHFDYMKRMGFCQEKLHENGGTDGWDGRTVEEQRTLVCSLLIKCADISNVARHFEVAAKWATILTDEFARQASMEKDLEIPSALFAPPIRDSLVELGKSQIGFMNLFALPLFQGVTDLLPGMQFSVDQMHSNKATWQRKIELEHEKPIPRHADLMGSISPRSGSPERLVQPETFPAGAVAPVDHLSSSSLSEIPEKDLSTSPPNSATKQSPAPPSVPSTRARQSSLGSSQTPEGSVDTGSQNSAGAFPAATSPPSQTRRSSNTPPSQLQIGVGSAEAQRPSADHSLVAVLVASPQKPPKTADSHAIKNSRRKSSEKSSLPSSQDRHSQMTSPTNMAYSPTTQGTSFLSVDSAEKIDVNGHTSSGQNLPSSPPQSQYSGDFTLTPRVDQTSTLPKAVRHRPSRWKLNFWKGRRKVPAGESPRSSPSSNGV